MKRHTREHDINDSDVTYLHISGSDDKASAYNAGYRGLIPGLVDLLEKEMAIRSSIPAWKIP